MHHERTLPDALSILLSFQQMARPWRDATLFRKISEMLMPQTLQLCTGPTVLGSALTFWTGKNAS